MFYPLDGRPFVVPLALRVMISSQKILFVFGFDGSAGLYIHPNICTRASSRAPANKDSSIAREPFMLAFRLTSGRVRLFARGFVDQATTS